MAVHPHRVQLLVHHHLRVQAAVHPPLAQAAALLQAHQVQAVVLQVVVAVLALTMSVAPATIPATMWLTMVPDTYVLSLAGVLSVVFMSQVWAGLGIVLGIQQRLVMGLALQAQVHPAALHHLALVAHLVPVHRLAAVHPLALVVAHPALVAAVAQQYPLMP